MVEFFTDLFDDYDIWPFVLLIISYLLVGFCVYGLTIAEPGCIHAFESGAFCSRCGAALQDFCSSCGAALN